MSTPLRSCCLFLLSSLLVAASLLTAQTTTPSPESLRDIQHQSPQWPSVQAHLPDPATATPEKLEMAGDILRARRFPEDALDFYHYALQRGGQGATLMDKLGVTELELRNTSAARVYFQRAIHLQKKDSQGWNNLGVVDYLDRQYGSAISNYKHAIKLDKGSAIFHSNLGTAYFEEKDFKSARRQFDVALRLDPQMSEHDAGAGVTAHMLSPADHARFCFEMARMYAERGDEASLLRYLTMASEGGFDVLREMGSDSVLGQYRKDPRVLLLVRTAQALRSGHDSVADAKGALTPLPAEVSR